MTDIESLPVSESTKQLLRDSEAWLDVHRENVQVYGEGVCYASVCTTLDDEAADAAMAARPSGTSGGWQRSADATFSGGLPNPCPCEAFPETRRHILYEA